MRLLLSILILWEICCASLSVYAKEKACSPIFWEKSTGWIEEINNRVAQLSDKNFARVTYHQNSISDKNICAIQIAKFDSAGKRVGKEKMHFKPKSCSRNYQILAIVALPEGGFATLSKGQNDQFWMIKFSNDGEIVFEKAYNGTADSLAFSNNAFWAAGIVCSDPESKEKAVLTITKIDADGKSLLTNSFPLETAGCIFGKISAIAALSDGNFGILADLSVTYYDETPKGKCDGYPEGCSDIISWFIKVDKSGKSIWQKNYAEKNQPVLNLLEIHPLADGDAILLGYNAHKRLPNPSSLVTVTYDGIWVGRIDSQGKLLWKVEDRRKVEMWLVIAPVLWEKPSGKGFVVKVVAKNSASYSLEQVVDEYDVSIFSLEIDGKGKVSKKNICRLDHKAKVGAPGQGGDKTLLFRHLIALSSEGELLGVGTFEYCQFKDGKEIPTSVPFIFRVR